MKISLACFALAYIALMPAAMGAPPADEAGRTECQAYARALKADLDGQRVMIDRDAAILSPTAADTARLSRRRTEHDADAKLYNSLVVMYAKALRPTPEMMANIRSNTSMMELRRLAQACL